MVRPPDEAKRLYHEGGELKKRFNELSGWRRKAISRWGSTAGPPDRIYRLECATLHRHRHRRQRLASRCRPPFELDSVQGWGVRTLSSAHPAYNPYGYHRGTVWPVEQGPFASAFLRLGLHKHVHLITKAQFEAAALFEHYRLPEVFSGHHRDEDHPFPALYPKAKIASSLVRVGRLLFPAGDAWSLPVCAAEAAAGRTTYSRTLQEITLTNLRVGDATTTIRFYRKADGKSDYEVQDVRGSLHVIRQPSPWSLTASFAERLKDALTSFLPGK